MFILTVYSPLGARGKVVRIPGCKGNVFPRDNKIFWRKKEKRSPLHPPRGGSLYIVFPIKERIKNYRSHVPTKDYA
jgi:hypothetical protein